MQIQLNILQFTVQLNTLYDDLQSKQQLLTKLQTQFLRQYGDRITISQYHPNIISSIRMIVKQIQKMYQQLKQYLYELKIPFLYDFIRKNQTLMLIGYNFISQILSTTNQLYEEQKQQVRILKSINHDSEKKLCYNCEHTLFMNKNDRFKMIQQLDHNLMQFSSLEQKKQNQMNQLYQIIISQKNNIEKIKPSIISKELQSMKQFIERIIEYNQKSFDQNYMLKFHQFRKYIKNIQTPDNVNGMVRQIDKNLKNSFVKHSIKAAENILNIKKTNKKNFKQISIQTGQQKDIQINPCINTTTNLRTQKALLNKNQQQQNIPRQDSRSNNKFKKNTIQPSFTQLKKSHYILTQQLKSLKLLYLQLQCKYKQQTQKYLTLQSMYTLLKDDYEKVKVQIIWVNEKKQYQMLKLKEQIQKERRDINIKKQKYQQSNKDKNNKHNNNVININGIDCGDNKVENKISEIQKNHKDNVTLVDQQTQVSQIQLYNQTQNLQNQVVKLLKKRNQKAIQLINQKDKRIRESTNRISQLYGQTHKLKTYVHTLVGLLEEQFAKLLEKKKQIINQNNQNNQNNGNNQNNENNENKEMKQCVQDKNVVDQEKQINLNTICQRVQQILRLIAQGEVVFMKKQKYQELGYGNNAINKNINRNSQQFVQMSISSSINQITTTNNNIKQISTRQITKKNIKYNKLNDGKIIVCKSRKNIIKPSVNCELQHNYTCLSDKVNLNQNGSKKGLFQQQQIKQISNIMITKQYISICTQTQQQEYNQNNKQNENNNKCHNKSPSAPSTLSLSKSLFKLKMFNLQKNPQLLSNQIKKHKRIIENKQQNINGMNTMNIMNNFNNNNFINNNNNNCSINNHYHISSQILQQENDKSLIQQQYQIYKQKIIQYKQYKKRMLQMNSFQKIKLLTENNLNNQNNSCSNNINNSIDMNFKMLNHQKQLIQYLNNKQHRQNKISPTYTKPLCKTSQCTSRLYSQSAQTNRQRQFNITKHKNTHKKTNNNNNKNHKYQKHTILLQDEQFLLFNNDVNNLLIEKNIKHYRNGSENLGLGQNLGLNQKRNKNKLERRGKIDKKQNEICLLKVNSYTNRIN